MRVKITDATGVWFATAAPSNATPARQVVALNAAAKRKGITATYEVATEAEYQAYRAETRAIIAKGKS